MPVSISNLLSRPKLQSYRTHWGLWCGMSVVAFFAIGLLVRYDNKGSDDSLLRLSATYISLIFSEESDAAFSLRFWMWILRWMGSWLVVSAAIGWLFHGLLVIIINGRTRSRKD